MSSNQKPALGGARIKQRKRNIAVPHDPSSFADAITALVADKNGDLELIARDVDTSELDFSRYGETFFEVVFSGGRLQPGTIKLEEGAEALPWCVLQQASPAKELILPYVSFIQKILRRRPFMIKSLETVIRRSLQSLELYSTDDRQKLATFSALCFSQRLTGLAPEFLFTALLNDALISRGTSLTFVTHFLRAYLAECSTDDMIGLLKRGRVDDKLIEFFPSQKRTPEQFASHFNSEKLPSIVDYYKKVVFDVKLKELSDALADMLAEGGEVPDVMEMVKQRRREGSLADSDVVRTVWDCIMETVTWSGKNQQQNMNSALRQVRTWGKLLAAFCTTAKLELELMYKIQKQCYEDANMQKLFPDLIRTLYDVDVLAEDTILLWYRKGSSPKGRQLFVGMLEPFIRWLEEAEEED